MGGAHSRVEASITSPTSPPYVAIKTTHGSVPHTTPLQLSCQRQRSTTIYCAF